MNKAIGVAVTCVAAIAFTRTGVAAAPGAALRQPAHPRVGKVIAKVPIPPGTGGIAVGEGAVWSTSDAGPTLTRIDPARNTVAAAVRIDLSNKCPPEAPGCGDLAAGDGAVWIPHVNDNTVSRFDPSANAVTRTIDVGPQPRQVAVSPEGVWVANSGGPTVSRIDPSTNRVVA